MGILGFPDNADIIGDNGDALIPKGKNAIEINPRYFAAKMIKIYNLIFIKETGWNEWSPVGWGPVSEYILQSRIADLLQDEIRANFKSQKKSPLLPQRPLAIFNGVPLSPGAAPSTPAYDLINTRNIVEILRTMKYMCDRGDKLPPLDPDVIPVQNGILRWNAIAGDFVFQDHYTPNDLVFTRLNAVYDSNADQDYFLTKLVEILPDPEDRRVVQEYMGAALFPENRTRKFLLLQGEGGCGKSLLVKLLTAILTLDRTFDLDFRSLSGNYAFSALTSQTLLTASEAVSDAFCRSAGIEFVKKAVGGDFFQTRQKYRNKKVDHHGFYSLIAVSNNKLRFKYDGRGDEFKDRLLPIHFAHHIDNPDKTLVDTLLTWHRSAILAWLIAGAKQVRRNNWQIELTPAQISRRDRLVEATKGVDLFVKNHIKEAPGCFFTAEDAYREYTDLHRSAGFELLDEPVFYKRFARAMAEAFGHVACKNLPTSQGKHNARGYLNVALVNRTQKQN